jgi:hypothetical protein
VSDWGIVVDDPPVQLMLQGPLPQVTPDWSHELRPEQFSVQPPAPHFSVMKLHESLPLQSMVHGPLEQSITPLHAAKPEQSK